MAGPSGATTKLALPYPTPDDTVDVPRDVQALAEKLDSTVSVPIGGMVVWPGAAPPTGFRVCDGSTLPAASYPALEAVLGSAGGNITLPDLRDRVPVGTSGTRALKSTGGEAAHVLTGAESGMPSHSHTTIAPMAGFIGDSSAYTGWEAQGVTGTGRGITGNLYTAAEGPYNAAAAHNNMPPYIALNYVIRVT